MEWSWKLRLFGKMMSFSNIYLYFWLKRKKRYIPCLYRVCLYVF